jgi:3,4-dihydroxy 2-butanone 4-phosphate synthase/GTP cyclohydrolase II
VTGERCDELNLPLMSSRNTSRFGTGFCESIDAMEGVTTGISAHDRARAIQQAIDPKCLPSDLARPGHMFPLRAQNGGVLVREGQTEASVDLPRLAGLHPSGVICEMMNDDGSMARVPHLREFCRKHGMAMTSVAELIRYRLSTERFVKQISESEIQTEFGPSARFIIGTKSIRTCTSRWFGETCLAVPLRWYVSSRDAHPAIPSVPLPVSAANPFAFQ